MRIRLLFLFMIFATLSGFAQRVVTGVVTSAEDGLPVIGASVLEKGTTNGTITDFDGNYSLTVKENATLVLTYVGLMEKQVKVTAARINVILESNAIEMGEVVVTAMGVRQEKKKLNFAVQSMNSEDMTADRSQNFVNSLQGKVAGVNVTNSGGSPNGGSQIIIRGVSSINPSQGNEPLFVIDGMPLSGGASKAADINPNDIENVTVLKGAAASALYGQEGANGVIMITTKGGKAGAMVVTANASIQIDNAVRVPKIQTKYGPGAGGFYREQTSGGWGPMLDAGEQIYDNVGNFLQSGLFQKYDVSASGGTDKFNAYSSASYAYSDGVVPNDYLERITALLKASYKLSKELEVGMMGNISSSRSRGFGSSGMSSVYRWPINDDITNYKHPDGSIRYRYIADNKVDSPSSPLWGRHEDDNENLSTRYLMQGTISYTPLKDLNITGRINYDQSNNQSDGYNAPRFRKSDFTPEELDRVHLDNFGSYSFNSGRSQLFSTNVIGTYKVDLTNGFNLDLMAGTEMKMRKGWSSAVGGRDFIIPGIYSLANCGEILPNDSRMEHSQYRMYSFFGEVRLDYKGMLTSSVTMRNDHSSTLDPENNSYWYPSFTGGILFSELFKIDSDIFNYGKIRGNWAKVGKDTAPYLFDRKFKQFPTYPDQGFGSDPTSSVASKLKPEMSTSWEIGADFRLFNNKTKLDMAYYSTKVEDQIVTVRVSPASGHILQTRNEGSVKNHGVEFTIDQEIFKTKDFSWNAVFNFGLNRGTVLSLPDGIVEIQGTQYGDVFATAYLNGSTTAISGIDYLRAPDGQIVVNEQGYPIVNPAKGVDIGNREPNFLAGLTSNLKYKDLSLSFLFDFRKGGDVVNVTRRGLLSNGQDYSLMNYRNREVVFNGVVKQSDGSFTPNTQRITLDQNTLVNYYYNVSSNFVEKGSFCRLSYVTLTYDVSRYLKKSPIKGLRVSATGRNLFLLTKYTGSDPQVNASTSSGGSGGGGFDNYGVPNTRSYNFSLNATF